MRRWKIAFAGLLLAATFLPNVAQASGNDPLPQSSNPALAKALFAEAGCQADAQLGTPTPVFMQTGNGCGSCSDRFCQGSTIGNACAGGLYYTCQNALGVECTAQPTLWQCTCWPPNTPFP
jgi:hypothetical protein